MKHLRVITAFALINWLGYLTSCNQGDDPKPEQPDGSDTKASLASIQISMNEQFGVIGNDLNISIKIKGIGSNNQNFKDFEYDLVVNEESLGSTKTFEPTEAGDYHIYAKSGDIESNHLTYKLREMPEYEPIELTLIFHIMHDGEEEGKGYNIPYSRIQYQMTLLESVFAYKGLTANSAFPNLSFKLAETDPEGNVLPEPGVVRAQRPSKSASILYEGWMWDHYWDPDDYINIWVGDTKNGYSWGQYPSFMCNDTNIPDGLGCFEFYDGPIESRYITGIALELDNLWEGNMVFPHEMGHIMGLFHVFNDEGCNSDADFCADTFQYNRASYENGTTNNHRTSCELGHQFISYNTMDYWSQPLISRDFSLDQVERMRYTAEHALFVGNQKFDFNTLPTINESNRYSKLEIIR